MMFSITCQRHNICIGHRWLMWPEGTASLTICIYREQISNGRYLPILIQRGFSLQNSAAAFILPIFLSLYILHIFLHYILVHMCVGVSSHQSVVKSICLFSVYTSCKHCVYVCGLTGVCVCVCVNAGVCVCVCECRGGGGGGSSSRCGMW